LLSLLHDPGFLNRHRAAPSKFTRQRKLPFPVLCLVILSHMRSALPLGLERFFAQYPRAEAEPPDPSAFSKARRFLSASAFVELNELVLKNFAEQESGPNYHPPTPWHGLRLLVVDGTTLRLPNNPEIKQAFGGQQPAQGNFVTMARASILYDIAAGTILEAILSRYDIGEQEQAIQLVGENIGLGDCVVLDRGYNDPYLTAWIIAHGANVLLRIAVGRDARAKAFVESGRREEILEQRIAPWIVEEMKALGKPIAEVVKTRLVRVDLPTGEAEVLWTTLTDQKRYPADLFAGFYHQRWGVEGCYKRLKCYIEPENWSGKTPPSVEQDFHAAVLLHNLAAIGAILAAKDPEQNDTQGPEKKAAKKYLYKINMKRALGVLRDSFMKLITASAGELLSMMNGIYQRLRKARVPIRPNRTAPRKPSRRRPPSFSYKPF
jgi:hypothetical protein